MVVNMMRVVVVVVVVVVMVTVLEVVDVVEVVGVFVRVVVVWVSVRGVMLHWTAYQDI
jgi:hypothetical protein